MAKKRVIAYFMHEAEAAVAQAALSSSEATDSFIIGDIEEAEIPALTQRGVIVQELPSAPADTFEIKTMVYQMAPVMTTASLGSIPAVAAVADAFPQPEGDYYFVWLNGPLVERARQALAGKGVTLLEATQNGGYKAYLSAQQVQDIRNIAYVSLVQWISPAEAAPIVATESVVTGGAGVKMLTFDVQVHEPAKRPVVEGWLRARHVTIAGTGSRKVRFYVAENSPLLAELASRPEVAMLAEYVAPVLYNDRARYLLGIDLPGAVAASPALDGTGQLVGIADTGIDDQHPDFQGRIAGTVARGRLNNASDPSGHGTHVAGSVLGNGSASGGQIKGMAPGAKLFFQSLLDANGGLGGLPVDLNDLFDEAYRAGVRIHNNSWGANTASVYTVNSEEVDEFVHLHRDMLVVIAAGNAGTSGAQPAKAATGFVDWLSIGSPASSKNALTVGASRSDRANSVTWGSGWPGVFLLPPIATETIAGNPDALAAFSSRGPCDDRRIKPDVVAPGTNILSTLSSLAPSANFFGLYPANPRYAFDNGTSMAAPMVAGCAALVRQYYVGQGHSEPSAALLKATLVNSTQWLTGPDSTAPTAGRPNYHQGHGRVDMLHAVPNPARPGLELRFVDEWQTFRFTYTGQRKRYQFLLPQDAPELRFCLAYTDAPGRSLQNNLNLLVQYPDTTGQQQKRMGNEALPDALTLPDPDNNVECIRIEGAKMGTYYIQVFAANLLKAPQDFALVVTGQGVPPLVEI